jgi:hypothetical protein
MQAREDRGMNPAEYHAAVLDTLITELAKPAPEKPAKPLPKATHTHFVEVEEFGWEIEIGYCWQPPETPDDLPQVQIVSATLDTRPGRFEIGIGAFDNDTQASFEEAIQEAILVREAERHEDHHPRGCRCRDCLADLGDWMMEQRKDAQT